LEDHLHGAQLGTAFARSWAAAAEDQRKPFVGMREGGRRDQSRNQPVDSAHADRIVMSAAA
jgi:hypothetical protein